MSVRSELAPKRKRCGRSQSLPSSSFIIASQSMDCFAVRMPPAGLKPTASPVRSRYSRMARTMVSPTGRTAFSLSLPVEVLMKSAPAIMQTSEARCTLRSVPSSPVARMVFRCASPQASRKARTSSYSARHSPRSTCARVMTMSISAAPASTEARISSTRWRNGESPAGNPVDTAATGIPLPSSASTATGTSVW